ncbi:MAG: class I SAM-dependent methyltransferase [Dehalococcoidia bacterium]
MTVSKVIADPRRVRRLVAFVKPRRSDHVLDVGTGMLASAFAPRVESVVALSWETPRRRSDNVKLVPADPHELLLPEDSFDIVVCGPSFHHLTAPRIVVKRMALVTRPGGRVVVEDIIAAEQSVRARYQNRLERLRDRSHPGYLSLSQMIAYFEEAGLKVRSIQVHDLPREFNEWLLGGRSSPARIEHIRRLMVGAVEADLSGLQIRPVDDTVLFTQQIASIVAEKPA